MSIHARCVRTARAPCDPTLWGLDGTESLTFAMIKPDAVGVPYTRETVSVDEETGEEVPTTDVVAADKADAIKDRVIKDGFKIVRERRVRLSKAQAQAFYAEHAGREFFEDLTDFMSSGPLIAMVLSKVDAVSSWRQLIGPTNSKIAQEEAVALNPLNDQAWSLRAAFGTDGRRNAVHGSDSAFSSAREISFFFGDGLPLERTCAVIMPQAVSAGKTDEIIESFRSQGYSIVGRCDSTVTPDRAAGYFPPSMTDQITALCAGQSTALVLEKKGAVSQLAIALGPADAPIGGIPGGVYGAMSAEAASAQIHFWFAEPLPVERTLALIKPGTADTYGEDIIAEIRAQGFTIVDQKKMTLSAERAGVFYQEHKGKGFYNRLTQYMSSGPLIALVLSKPGAILSWRTVMGPTNTLVARKQAPSSIRARFGVDGTRNATHGSDSEASAFREISFFFPHHGGRAMPMLTGDKAKEYLAQKRCTEEKFMNQVLVDGLVALCKAKPVGAEAIRFLGKWLIENNPARPGAKAPESVSAPPAPAFNSVQPPVAPAAAKSKVPNGGVAIEMPEEEKKNIVFMMGGPGAGKGTQCAKVAAEFGYAHLSTGDLLRAEVAKGSDLGKQAQDIMASGGLVPDDIVLQLLKNAMAATASNKFLIDGYPRVIDQAWAFEQQIGIPSMVVSFDVTDATMTDRLVKRGMTSGRADDNEESIKKRLATFHEQTDQTIDFYERLGVLRRVNAEGIDAEQVWEATRKLFQPQCVFVMGPPGAGKGTVCKRIADKYHYEHLSVGDLFRAETARGSKVGTQIDRLIKNGQLVPDDITLRVLKRAMDKSPGNKFLLDGFPRSKEQAVAFEQSIGSCKFVLHITADKDVCRSRLLDRPDRRDDDTAGAFGKRMRTYTNKTLPAVAMYEDGNSVRTVNGNGRAEETYSEVRKVFEPTVIFVVNSHGLDNTAKIGKLAKETGYTHLVPGNLLRGEMSRRSPDGLMLQNMTSSGQIIPVDVTHSLILKAMTASGNDRFIIDMYPRALDQATAFETQVAKCSKVLYLKTSEETAVATHTSNGVAADQIARRVRTFNQQTLPVINYYGVQGRVSTIDCSGVEDEVYSACKTALSPVVVLACGKGKAEHCAKIAKQFNYVNMNMAALIDCEIARGGLAAERLSAGAASTDDCMALLNTAITSNHTTNQFIISGFPRTVEEATVLEGAVTAPNNVVFFSPDLEDSLQPVVDSYFARGLASVISGEGSSDEIYARACQSFRPTLVLCVSHKFASQASTITQVCLASNACRIQTTSLLLAEAESGSANGKIISESIAAGRTVPIDITVGLINNVVKAAPTTNFVIEGFPRLVSAGFPGVQDQLALLQSDVGDVAQLISMEVDNYAGPDASVFRLEKQPVVKYFERVNRANTINMSAEDADAAAAACDLFSTFFDPESRAAIRAKYLATVEDEERARIAAAEEGLGEEEEEAVDAEDEA
jgi:adenylate kinase